MDAQTSAGAKAVALWEELTGKAVSSSSYSFSVNGTSFDLYGANKRIKEALAIADDITIGLIVKTLAEHFSESEKFTLADILSGNEKLQARIDLIKRMNALFSSPEMKQQHENFYRYCEGALSHYRGIQPRELTEATTRFVRESGCFVGLDAYHGVNRLTRLMVCDGPTVDGSDTKVSQFVFAFHGIEDLISHAQKMPNGFSLCVIMAEHISDSYFAMVVRNGGRVLVLTDKGNYSHPLQESMMRGRNDRYNLNRIENSHFPYDLLGIVWGDNGRQARAGTGTSLTVSDSDLPVIGNLNDLKDWDLLWLHLFIDQCRERYFNRQETEPQLAIGTMIRLPHKWLPAEPALPVPVDFELRLDVRSSAELTTEFMHSIEPQWTKNYNPNRWMEKRFADQVPDECLYIPPAAMNKNQPLLESDHNGKAVLERRDLSGLAFWETREIDTVALRPLVTALSTPERVIRDAHYIARYNQAQVIKRLVERDYKEREGKIKEWWYKAAAKNLPNILHDLLTLNHERFWISRAEHAAALRQIGGGEPCHGKDSTVQIISDYRSITLRYVPVRKQHLPRKPSPASMPKQLGLENHHFAQYQCALDRSEDAQLFICLGVTCVLDIMTIAGLELSDIPPELHHFGINTYSGNNILDRLDPLAHIKNPWEALRLDFQIPVSLKGFKNYRREQGLTTPKASELEEFAKQTGSEAFDRHRQTKPVIDIDPFAGT